MFQTKTPIRTNNFRISNSLFSDCNITRNKDEQHQLCESLKLPTWLGRLVGHCSRQFYVVRVYFVVHLWYTCLGQWLAKGCFVAIELPQKLYHFVLVLGDSSPSLLLVVKPHPHRVFRVGKLFPKVHQSSFGLSWNGATYQFHGMEHSPHVLTHLQKAYLHWFCSTMLIFFVALSPVFNHGHPQVVGGKFGGHIHNLHLRASHHVPYGASSVIRFCGVD